MLPNHIALIKVTHIHIIDNNADALACMYIMSPNAAYQDSWNVTMHIYAT